MNWFDYFFVISISVFVLGSLILGTILLIKLKQRKTVKATIFLKAGGLITFWFNRDRKLEKNIAGCSYVLNETAVYKTRFRDYIYFMEDNPYPLIYNHKTGMPEITAGELNTILDDDLVKQLFNQGELKNIQILLFITLACGVVTMICALYLCFGSFKVKDTPELRQMIYNVTRSAILGVPV